MEAAFTVMVIFTISTILVRIASTIMRLTGLPDNVARFQSLSAMTGTGFTTRESELIVNYPIRRRVLMTLMIIGNLALTGFPFTAGYFSKDAIIESAFAGGSMYAFTLLVVAACFTSFYSWRLIFMTFYGPEKGDHHAHAHAHESPLVMTIPLAVLAVGAARAGACRWVGSPPPATPAYRQIFISPITSIGCSP